MRSQLRLPLLSDSPYLDPRENIMQRLKDDLQMVEEHLFPAWTEFPVTGNFNILANHSLPPHGRTSTAAHCAWSVSAQSSLNPIPSKAATRINFPSFSDPENISFFPHVVRRFLFLQNALCDIRSSLRASPYGKRHIFQQCTLAIVLASLVLAF